MAFIELTLKETESPLTVNTHHITAFAGHGDGGTTLLFSNGQTDIIKESYAEIQTLMGLPV